MDREIRSFGKAEATARKTRTVTSIRATPATIVRPLALLGKSEVPEHSLQMNSLRTSRVHGKKRSSSVFGAFLHCGQAIRCMVWQQTIEFSGAKAPMGFHDTHLLRPFERL